MVEIVGFISMWVYSISFSIVVGEWIDELDVVIKTWKNVFSFLLHCVVHAHFYLSLNFMN
jgi:hypothetical protein